METVSTLISVLGGALGGVVAASIGVAYQVRRDRHRRHKDMVDAVREALDGRIERVVAELRREDDKLHGRISATRAELHRIANLEGQLTQIRNLLDAIQQRYIVRDGK